MSMQTAFDPAFPGASQLSCKLELRIFKSTAWSLSHNYSRCLSNKKETSVQLKQVSTVQDSLLAPDSLKQGPCTPGASFACVLQLNEQPLHLCLQILTSASCRHLTAPGLRTSSPAQLENKTLCITQAPCPPSGLLAGAWQPQAADRAIPASLEHDGAPQPLKHLPVSLQQQAAASAARLCQLRAGTGVCCHRFVSVRSVLCLCLATQPAWPQYYIKAKLAPAIRLPMTQSSAMCIHAAHSAILLNLDLELVQGLWAGMMGLLSWRRLSQRL